MDVTVVGATSPLGISVVPGFTRDGWNVRATFRDAKLVLPEWSRDERVSAVELDLAAPRNGDENAFESDVIVWLADLDAGRFNETEVESNTAALLAFLDRVDTTTDQNIRVCLLGRICLRPRRETADR